MPEMPEYCEPYFLQMDAFMQFCFREGRNFGTTERALWTTLHFHVYDNGGRPVALTAAQVMRRSGISSPATLRSALGKLERAGLVEVVPSAGRKSASYLTLVPEDEAVFPIPDDVFEDDGGLFAAPGHPEEEVSDSALDDTYEGWGAPPLSASACRAAQGGDDGFASVCERIREFYNSHRNRMRECRVINADRKEALRRLLFDYSEDQIKEAIEKASGSDWLNGLGRDRSGKPVSWRADFDWVISKTGRLLEGFYDNKTDEGRPDYFETVAATAAAGMFPAGIPAAPEGA